MTEARGGPKGGSGSGPRRQSGHWRCWFGGRPSESPRASLEDAAQVLPSADDAVVRRTKDGWRVGGAELPDLTSAMVLADLLAAELAASDPAATATSARTNRAADSDKAKEAGLHRDEPAAHDDRPA